MLWLCQESRKSVRQNSTFFPRGKLERDDGLCLQRHMLFAIKNRASRLCAVVWNDEGGAMLLLKEQSSSPCLWVTTSNLSTTLESCSSEKKHVIVAADFWFPVIYFSQSWQIDCLALAINSYNFSSCHGHSCNSEILNTSGFLCSLREEKAYITCPIS